jgi:two-component system, OmpR family, response regulator
MHNHCLPFNGLRLLVVDDEPDSRELLTFIFEENGAEMIEAASAREALEVLERFKPDILISDINLPDEDGYSLMLKVRNLDAERGGKIPAIAVSGYAEEEDCIRSLSAGFHRHLSKPIDLNELTTVVATLVGRDK